MFTFSTLGVSGCSRMSISTGEMLLTSLKYESQFDSSISRSTIYNSFLEYTWIQGGGLPLPSPTIVNLGTLTTGLNCRRILPPSNISEEIIAVDYPSSLSYTVNNPSWLTGFPVVPGSHKGSITLTDHRDNSGHDYVKIVWTVDFIPLGWLSKVAASFLTKVLSFSRFIRNLVSLVNTKYSHIKNTNNRNTCSSK